MKFINILHPLIRLAYIAAYAKLKFVSQIVWGIEIWPRHSFLTKAFIPLKSDLDLTAYVSNLDSLNSYMRFYRIYKKVLPFIGELNVYTPDLINFIKNKDVNGFELERDPILVSRFHIDLSKGKYFSREKAASYLLMALVNDLHKLKADPGARLKKWNYHFEHVNASLLKRGISAKMAVLNEQTLIFSIITTIVNLGNPASAKQAELLRTKIRLFLEFLPQADTTPNFIDLISPAITDENADVYGYFVEYLATTGVSLPAMSQLQFEMMSEQIKWVAFRFLKQSYGENDCQIASRLVDELSALIQQYLIVNPSESGQMLADDLGLVSDLLLKRCKANC